MVRDGKKENHLLDQKHGKGWQEWHKACELVGDFNSKHIF
jgi:hypothetical protein